MPKQDPAAPAAVQTPALIKPTVGRIVLFHPSSSEGAADFAPAEICAAVVAFVHSDTCVNLAVFDANGVAHSKTSVLLVQGDAQPPEGGYWCEWMPYQKGQAARTDQVSGDLEKRVAALEKEHPKHSASRQVSAGDIVIVREHGHASPAIVTAVAEDGRLTCNVFRGDHAAHSATHLDQVDPDGTAHGWFWPSEQS